MKKLSQIKDEAAQNNGYADWAQIEMTELSECEQDSVKAGMIDDIAKKVAEEVKNEAAIWVGYHVGSFPKCEKETKQSILNIELK